MTVRFRAHYDGKAIVPDEPVDLPVNEELTVSAVRSTGQPSDLSTQEYLAELDELASHAVDGADIPADALLRENLYDDRGR
jgi:hypothetical protein